MKRLNLIFRWPSLPDPSFNEEFFVGVWHPSADIKVSLHDSDLSPFHHIVSGRNWFILSSKFPFNKSSEGLAHIVGAHSMQYPEQREELVAFRGYILDPPIHTWSSPEEITTYWMRDHTSYNGIFCAACIKRSGEELSLITDAFGIMALYYRVSDGAVFFSTNSRFLSMPGDRLDLFAARTLIQCGSVYGDRSLTESVCRVPPGTSISFEQGSAKERRWFSFDDISSGTKPVSSNGLKELEAAFQNSIDRCLQLKASRTVLPLSSGDDSRRILAALHSRHLPFKALTVRTFHRNKFDLDAPYASQMAHEFGFDHKVIELPEPKEFAGMDKLRRVLVDFHGSEHTWFLPLSFHLPQESCLIFDGLAGDVVSNTGFGLDTLFDIHVHDVRLMFLSCLIGNEWNNVLNNSVFPSVGETRYQLHLFLQLVPYELHFSELAYLITRTRSGPGMCSQRLIPAGHLTVYPYLDLDYVRLALSFDPKQKIPPDTLQARCLAMFWPQYYRFPSSRRIPKGFPEVDRPIIEQRERACFQQLKAETLYPAWHRLRKYLSKAYFVAAVVGAAHPHFSSRLRWWLAPILSLRARDLTATVCWSKK